MKIKDLINELNSLAPGDYELPFDGYAVGTGEDEISGVVVAMFATPDVIRSAAEKGANLIIMHEPFFQYNEDGTLHKTTVMKKQLAESNGITVYRYHDRAHRAKPDMICTGELKYLGFDENFGTFESGNTYPINYYHLNNEMTARELSKLIENRLQIPHIRIIGEADKPGKDISLCFGATGHHISELDKCDFLLAGEICEWEAAETARDYAAFGYNKAILVLGHIGSERAGMMHIRDIINKLHPELGACYEECGLSYTYAD